MPRTLPIAAFAFAAGVFASAIARAEATPTEPHEVEVVTLNEEAEPDRQRIALGLSAGPAWIDTKGSGPGQFGADFSIQAEFGLGEGGARVPWSLGVDLAFDLTRSALSSTALLYPARFTTMSGRAIYRGEPGGGSLLSDRFLAVGAGVVFTNWGSCKERVCPDAGELKPAFLLDLAAGVYEWTLKTARYGFALRTPVEISSHWGGGVMFVFYGQAGIVR